MNTDEHSQDEKEMNDIYQSTGQLNYGQQSKPIGRNVQHQMYNYPISMAADYRKQETIEDPEAQNYKIVYNNITYNYNINNSPAWNQFSKKKI
jgi:cyclin-dependent kinase-like